MVGCVVSCSERQEVDSRLTLPIAINLPADGVYQPAGNAPARRAFGDPGTTERLLLPEHIYLIVLKQLDDDSWQTWHVVHREPTSGEWNKKRYNGDLNSKNDTIYQLKEEIVFPLSNASFNGLVYAVASAVPLTFNKAFSADAIRNLNDVLTLTFNTSSTTVQENLQHIYSTPYNYFRNGAYYGAFSTHQRVPHVELMLYHVAAKVDIKWSVAADKRIDLETPSNGVRLTYMEARRLFNGYAYCFQPLRNRMAALPSSGGYDIPNIVTPADEGLWWEGRTYFYTIPYVVDDGDENPNDYFPLQLMMRTNGTSGTGYQLTLNQPIDTSGVFVPWIRGNFNFTQPLTDKSETKTIGD